MFNTRVAPGASTSHLSQHTVFDTPVAITWSSTGWRDDTRHFLNISSDRAETFPGGIGVEIPEIINKNNA